MKIPWRHSIAARLLLGCVAALVLTLALVNGVLIYAVNQQSRAMVVHNLAGKAAVIRKFLHFDAAGRPIALELPTGAQWLFSALPDDVKYRVLDPQGRVLFSSDGDEQPMAPPGQAFDPVRINFLLDSHGAQLKAMTMELQRPQGRYFLQVANSERFDEVLLGVTMRPLTKAIAFTSIVAAIIFGAMMFFTLRQMLKPLRDASQAAAGITPLNLHTRLAEGGMPAEVRPLVQAFNQALGRLEKGYQVQQSFLAAAAHELKTPLTLIRGQIEMEEHLSSRTALLRDVDLMARQVQQLLHLAELSETQNYVFAPIAVYLVMHDVATYLAPRAAQGRVRIEVNTVDAPLEISADRSALFILLKNLVENAVLHAPPDSIVTLSMESATLSVRDAGPGIAEEHLPQLFQRFWRAPGRPYAGAGLGLAICREIALAHGWALRAQGMPAGACFTLTFTPG